MRAMAVWALSRLLSSEEFARLRADNLDREQDPDVRGEWDASSEGSDTRAMETAQPASPVCAD